jgi:hypothetical protein
VDDEDGFREGLNPSCDLPDGLFDLPDGQITSSTGLGRVESRSQKYFALPVGQIISTSSRRPVPLEGRFAIVTNAGRDAVDAAGAADESA